MRDSRHNSGVLICVHGVIPDGMFSVEEKEHDDRSRPYIDGLRVGVFAKDLRSHEQKSSAFSDG